MTETPTVAIVVVTWNSSKPLPGLLESLDAGMEGLRFETIIVDNDSADDTIDVAKRLRPDCRVVQTGRNAGYAAGINAGLDAAGPHDAVLVLNPDIRLTPGCVASLYAVLDERTGIAVPRIRNEDGTLALSLRREPSIPRAIGEAVLGQRAGRVPYLGETVLAERAYHESGLADWATGACMLISHACQTACGPWDESFFLYSEETDFALRARDHGYATRFIPASEVTHLGGESRVSPRLWSVLTVNRVRLYRKRHSKAATALFWSAIMLRESSRALLGQERSKVAVKALVKGGQQGPT